MLRQPYFALVWPGLYPSWNNRCMCDCYIIALNMLSISVAEDGIMAEDMNSLFEKFETQGKIKLIFIF